MLTGNCLCGSVAYEVDADPGPIVHCHCRTCRKTHGSAFSTVTNVPRDRFRWIRGEDLLKGFKSFARQDAVFLHANAARISSPRARARTPSCFGWAVSIRRLPDRPKMHIWRSDGASWFDPKDQLPEWPEGTPPKG